MGYCGSSDPTNSVKALKEDRVLRINLQSHQVHLTVLQSALHVWKQQASWKSLSPGHLGERCTRQT